MLKHLRLLAVLAILGLGACTSTARMYDGEPRSPDDVGRIEGMHPYNPTNGGVSARIVSVDGEPVPGDGFSVELLPGQYTLVLSVDSVEMTTQLVVEPGHHYVIAKVFSGGDGPGMIVDTTRH